MSTLLDTRPDDVADKAAALEAAGDFAEAASEYARAATLYIYERDQGSAQRMRQASLTARRAAEVHPLG